MGEEKKNPQKLKRIEAAAYDYDNDPRWADYWSNILIPSHMASRSDVVDHFKRKFYQCYIDPDLVVEAMRQANYRNPQNLLLHPQLHQLIQTSTVRKTGGNFKGKLGELGGLEVYLKWPWSVIPLWRRCEIVCCI
ncbi:hypothetical protein V6N11_018606 [Hibiscus sabdariffa]|uniref:Uncharacterized protein n=1 Tax=Hibiscus sabdariffa TaxID=183260 RepID=A0ABR2N8D2_9ROSI